MLVGLICNVEFKAISAESGTAHGLSPVLAILDELGQVRGPQDAFVEAIETALRNMAAKLDNIEQALRKK
jgi:phage terminase large subunit-like protein